MGPCFQRDASGNLEQNTRSLANMTDIESFQRDRPTATLFDVEFFYLGWEAGAKWAESSYCRAGTEERPCNPPDCKRIPDSIGCGGAE
jgi:hypothetical protein